MEQYDAIMENAHMIAEKERQRQEKEQESVLASSLFNGMEGIDTGGAELGAGLTDQKGQDSQDSQCCKYECAACVKLLKDS
jgi:hypothetical protein